MSEERLITKARRRLDEDCLRKILDNEIGCQFCLSSASCDALSFLSVKVPRNQVVDPGITR